MTIRIKREPFHSAPAQELLASYGAEIADLYPGWNLSVGPPAGSAEFEPPNGLFLVAYLDQLAIGCGGIKRFAGDIAELKRLYVAPGGRRRGLATLLLEHLEKAARARGFKAMRLTTGDRQSEALQLFRSAGYQEIPRFAGDPFASYWFEKRLS